MCRGHVGRNFVFILGYHFWIPHYIHADIKQQANTPTTEQFHASSLDKEDHTCTTSKAGLVRMIHFLCGWKDN